MELPLSVRQRLGQIEFGQPLEIELDQLFAYFLQRVHFLLSPGLARGLLRIIRQIFLHDILLEYPH